MADGQPKVEQPLAPPTGSTEDTEKGKGLAWLSYLGILWLVPMLANKDNQFCKFHVKQGIMLTILAVATGVVAWIPILGWLIGIVVYLFILVMEILGIVNALSGKYWKLPVLGDLAANWFRF